MNLSKQSAVTLIALVITVILLLILASVGYYYGNDVIRQANLESLKTDMLLIQAKAKEYVEEATFKMGINPDDAKKQEARQEVYINTAKLKQLSQAISEDGLSVPSEITTNDNFYYVTRDALKEMGLDKIETGENNGEYLIEFDENNATAEIYNTKGRGGKYSLTEIDKIEE